MASTFSMVLPTSRSSYIPPRLATSFSRFTYSDWSGCPSLHCRIKVQNLELIRSPVCRRYFSQIGSGNPTATLTSDWDNIMETEDSDGNHLGGKQMACDRVNDNDTNSEALSHQQMVTVCDKLIDVFMVDKPHTADWRRLLAFSREWVNIRSHFYNRCQERAEAEDEPGMKQALLRLGRKLKEIDEDVQQHDELLMAVKKASPDVSELIVRRRKDFTIEFFEHFHAVAESYHDFPTEREALVELQSRCLDAIEAYDHSSESIEALNAAELKFKDIISSPTLSDACRKIDNLAEKKQLDSALMLMITKAWAAVKDTHITKDEAKDILYYLYTTSMKHMENQVSKETRILRHLLKIRDPEELLSTLTDAFTPGSDAKALYTTPEDLFTWIQIIVDAYSYSKQGTLLGEARDMMNPDIIVKLEELKRVIKDKFM